MKYCVYNTCVSVPALYPMQELTGWLAIWNAVDASAADEPVKQGKHYSHVKQGKH